MNAAHLHLIINHVPVVALPLTTLFLIFSIYKKNSQMKNFCLLIIVFIGIFTVPVYLTGEPAEHYIEDFPAVTEAVISAHEEMGEKTLILMLITATFSLAAISLRKNEKINGRLAYATAGLAIFTSMCLVYTAFVGGQIRHTETRSMKKIISK